MRITEICPWRRAPGLRDEVSGQNFDNPSWNTLVRRDGC